MHLLAACSHQQQSKMMMAEVIFSNDLRRCSAVVEIRRKRTVAMLLVLVAVVAVVMVLNCCHCHCSGNHRNWTWLEEVKC